MANTRLFAYGILAATLFRPTDLAGQVAGGQGGYDSALEAIEPANEPVRVGLAGADPVESNRLFHYRGQAEFPSEKPGLPARVSQEHQP